MGELTPEQERELVIDSMPRRLRRKARRKNQPGWNIPDVMKGLTNHQRMMLKKVGRAGQESKSRASRNSKHNYLKGNNTNGN